MDRLERLQRWYRSHCDGTWEHAYGVRLTTIDNPGWRLEVALTGTPLAQLPFAEVKVERTEDDWVQCWVAERKFHGACGPENLAEMLDGFLAWSDTARRTR